MSTLDEIHEDIRDMRISVDALGKDFNDYRVHVEGRLTKVETRAGILSLLVSVFTSAVAGFWHGK